MDSESFMTADEAAEKVHKDRSHMKEAFLEQFFSDGVPPDFKEHGCFYELGDTSTFKWKGRPIFKVWLEWTDEPLSVKVTGKWCGGHQKKHVKID